MKINFKRVLKTGGIILGSLILILAVHIYIVTRPNPDRKAMARIDLHQSMSPADENTIAVWLYQQKGIDHVYCSPASQSVIFSFYPAKTTANTICDAFKADLTYTHAQRFIPEQKDMDGSCPVMATSVTYKVYHFFQHIF